MPDVHHQLQVSGPTSFSGLDSIIREGSSQTNGAASLRTGKDAARKSSLLGRLAGRGNKVSNAASSLSAVDLQNALATSFGLQKAARANNAMRR